MVRGPFPLDDKINNKLLLLARARARDKKCNFKITIIIIN